MSYLFFQRGLCILIFYLSLKYKISLRLVLKLGTNNYSSASIVDAVVDANSGSSLPEINYKLIPNIHK